MPPGDHLAALARIQGRTDVLQPSKYENMRKLNSLAYGQLIVAILLLISRSTRADSLNVAAGQVVQLGQPFVATNYSFTSVTIDVGETHPGFRECRFDMVRPTSSSMVECARVATTAAARGSKGDDGADGVVTGGVAGDGEDGEETAAMALIVVAGAGVMTIAAKNMIVNGSILFNPQSTAGDGGDGGGRREKGRPVIWHHPAQAG